MGRVFTNKRIARGQQGSSKRAAQYVSGKNNIHEAIGGSLGARIGAARKDHWGQRCTYVQQNNTPTAVSGCLYSTIFLQYEFPLCGSLIQGSRNFQWSTIRATLGLQ